MTYGELATRKTFGWVTNHVIDDVVSNARWAWPRGDWKAEMVSQHELDMIADAARREGISW